jgi:hypothetical protein
MQGALGQATEQYGRALGDVSANIVGTQYDQERARQQQAMMGLTNIAQAAPSIYGQQYLPSQQLAQVGAQREAIAMQPLQEAMSRYSFGQQLPYQQLSGYLSSVYGSPTASYGSTSQNMSTNPTVGAIGGALGGGLLGSSIGGAFGFPGLGAGIGALGGGLLGGFS